jgi:hypothetical protein
MNVSTLKAERGRRERRRQEVQRQTGQGEVQGQQEEEPKD